jgi:uncharacterized membrane protein YfcA
MYISPYLLLLIGILFEVPSIENGPHGDMAQDTLGIVGCILIICALGHIASKKGRSKAWALFAILAIPGTIVGLIVLKLLPNRLAEDYGIVMGDCSKCGKRLHKSGRCVSCDGVV